MESSTLPLGILLLGVAGIAGFMAFRPWPVAAGGTDPVKPGTYVVEVLSGHPPAASLPPDRQQEIGVIEGGLLVVLGVWAASKAASTLHNLTSGSSGLGKILGGAGSILGKIFGSLKGVLSNPEADTAIADAAEAA